MRIEYDDAQAGVAPPRYLHLPVVDDEAPALDQLREGSDFIAREIADGGAVYVHCGSGIGRAATMAAAYLISTGLAPDEAIMRIRKKRPFIRPTSLQLAQLERYAAKIE
jgi:protein-tyrosine phosphatase